MRNRQARSVVAAYLAFAVLSFLALSVREVQEKQEEHPQILEQALEVQLLSDGRRVALLPSEEGAMWYVIQE